VTTMSSSSNTRPSSHAERRVANENGPARARAPSAQERGSQSPRADPRRSKYPPTSASGTTHRRAVSSSQGLKGAGEERRTERVQVTTRETLTSRTRSPERRPGPPMQRQERARQSEVSRATSGDTKAGPSRTEAPQGRKNHSQTSQN
jgi:gamma-tubulin complex component 2